MTKILVAFAIVAFLATQSRDVARFPTGTAVLTGAVVLDEQNGQPIPRALVSVVPVNDPRQIIQTSTDDQGRFRMTGLAPGNVRLVANKPGYVSTYFGATQPGSTVGRPIALTNGQTIDLTIRLPRGGVITGTVTDDNGQPMPSVGVRVQRVATSSLGKRSLTSFSGALIPSTDDRGVYRIYGLPAGDYVVMAQPRLPGAGEVRPTSVAELQWAEQQMRAGAGAAAPSNAPASPEPSQTLTYAAVYFPGTVNVAAAGTVSVTTGQERSGIDLRMQFVPTARIEGAVTTAEGQPARGVQILLVPESEMENADADRFLILMEVGLMGGNAVTPTAADGSFSVQNVEPGAYTVLARTGLPGRAGGPAAEASWAMTDIRVDGHDIKGLALQLAPGQKVSGRVTFEGTAPATAPRISTVLRPQSTKGVSVTTSALAVGQPDNTFTISGLIPSPYRVTASAPGWTLKSAMLGGRDVADVSFEIKPGEDVSGLVLTLTDTPAEVTGVLYDGAGRPSGDLSIVLFSTDRTMWFTGSRRVRPAVRPATDGRFTFSGLIAGEYYLAALSDVSAAELTNPQFLEQVVPAAIKIAIANGEKKTQDLRIK